MRFRGVTLVVGLLTALARPAVGQQVEIVVDPALGAGPVTGRAFVIFSRDNSREPRLQAGSYGGSVPFFGVDVSGLEAGSAAVIDAGILGFPLKSLADLPTGDYYVQGLLSVYTQVTPKHGKTIWLPWDQWEGRRWNRTPGSLVSAVQRVSWDRGRSNLRLTLARRLPPVETPPDTRWVRRVKIQSTLLTEWWGRPVYLGAVALLPRGWEENPTTRYPAIYVQDHFNLNPPFGFNPEGKPETPESRAARRRVTEREPGYEFAQAWMGDNFPRMVAITFQHPTPYYDDSYAVNSANNGPYGDAIIQELIPHLERTFRLIPRASARLLTGGSTGGWEALALQIYHPKFFGGVWSLYPDGVDFSRNQMIDNYADSNAFVPNTPAGQWIVADRLLSRDAEGQPGLTVRQMAQLEETLGGRVRGGQQLQAYDAVYGPVGDDGYPKPLFDRKVGTIDKSVAGYWRDQGYDLNHYLEQNWRRIGPDLRGKLKVYVGDMDNFFLNLAVYRMEETAKSLTLPRAEAVFEYGRPTKPHGWQPFTNAELVRMMARQVARRSGVEGR